MDHYKNQQDLQNEAPSQINAANIESTEDVPTMNTLSERVNKAIKNGYTDNFKINKRGLYSETSEKTYLPAEVSIIDFYRFEGESDPADSSIMYVMETKDGNKGVLIDAYGAYADAHINRFITEVQEMNKKINTTPAS